MHGPTNLSPWKRAARVTVPCAWLVTATVMAAGLLASPVAVAGGGGKNAGKGGAQQARAACREEARSRGYEIRDITGTRSRNNGRFEVRLRLREDGRNLQGVCTWRRDSRSASLEVEQRGSGSSAKDGDAGLGQQARKACREEARDRDYGVASIGDTSRKDGKAHLTMRLRRDGEDWRGTCTYDGDRRSASLSVERRGGGGNAQGSGHRSAKKLREACISAAAQEGYEIQKVGSPRTRRNDRVIDMVLFGGGANRFECVEDSRGEVRIRPQS